MADIKLEKISAFSGFGNDNVYTKGEHHRSSGFRKSQNGMTTQGYLSHLMDFTTLTEFSGATPTSMIYSRSKAVATQSRSQYLMAANSNGSIIQSFLGIFSGTSAEYVHRSMASHTYAMSLIQDQKGRTLYLQDRYLGMFNGLDTVNNNDVAGTVAVTNGSNAVVGTGTAFVAGMVGKAFRVTGDTQKKFYTVATYTDATHITLSDTYTGSTASSQAYIINSQWNDTWKDFGASMTSGTGGTQPLAPVDIYEDTVLFGRNNKITTLNVTTDTITTDALPAFSLPSGYEIQHIVSNSNGIMIGANVNNKGVIMLWDNISIRSSSPWLWFDDEILSICKYGAEWIVTTGRGFYKTNGYDVQLIQTDFLDTERGTLIYKFPKSTIVVGNTLIFGGSSGQASKRRNVMYRLDLKTGLVDAAPRSNLNQMLPQFYQFIYVSSFFNVFSLLSAYAETGVDVVRPDSSPLCSSYVSEPVGVANNNQKIARGIKVRLRKNSNSINVLNAFTFKITAKIMDMKETIYNFAQVKQDGSPSEKNKITVNNGSSSFFTPPVGYEIEIPGDGNASGNNNCGYSRNITNVSGGGTSTEVYTLDEDFPSISLQSQTLIYTPFQLIKRKTITVTNGEIQEIYFDIKNNIKSNRFMVKFDIEDNTSGIPIEIEDADFIYEDLNVL